MKETFIIVLSFVLSFTAFCPSLSKDHHQQEFLQIIREQAIQDEIANLEESEFNIFNLVRYLRLIGVDKSKSDIIVKQAIIESGWFKSKLFVNYNNLFGMCMPRSRETLAVKIGMRRTVYYESTDKTINYKYAAFNHWTDAVKDLLLLHQYYENKGIQADNYYAFLDKIGYCYESNYVKTLKSINLDKEFERFA